MKIKSLYKSLYPLRNFLTFQSASAEQIMAFMKMVRPQTTNHELIRLGGINDGGYLIPDDFKGIKICFSPGVSDRSDFEEAMAQRGIRSFMADYSVDGPAHANQLFSFEKKFLGPKNDTVNTTLESWVDRNATNEKDFILQMDIENSEYDVLATTPRNVLQKFRIMTIEFHRLGELRNKNHLKKVESIFSKLLLDFEIVHIHPNSAASVIHYRGLEIPRIMEFTFLRKDRVKTKFDTAQFPHTLDRSNQSNSSDLILPPCWYVPD